MTIETLREFIRREPFEPFVIRLLIHVNAVEALQRA
jgi:hypothetical protein